MEKLAIVVPCYNEEEVLKIASEALRGVLDDLIHKGKIAEDSFILFVNDGSKDRTWELIEEEHQAHPVQLGGEVATRVLVRDPAQPHLGRGSVHTGLLPDHRPAVTGRGTGFPCPQGRGDPRGLDGGG